jgi:hypothetical protein
MLRYRAMRRMPITRNYDMLKTASGQPINEAKVIARGQELMARDADLAKALNAAMKGGKARDTRTGRTARR